VAHLQGRRREALRWLTLRSEALVRAAPSAANRLSFSIDTAFYEAYGGDAVRSRAVLDRGLARHPLDSMPPSDRPWDLLAELGAAIAAPDLSRRALAGFERDQAPTARDPIGRRAYYSAHVALAERRWDAAVGLLREADTRTSIDQRHAMAQIGRAYDLAGRPDSAMVYYQQFLATRDGQPDEDSRWRAQAHRWLGELYEAQGKTREAIEQYARFVELWADADPELQPQVSEVRSRLQRLRAQMG
jgi:eukaryotic-like serine/threonine-protein kinase